MANLAYVECLVLTCRTCDSNQRNGVSLNHDFLAVFAERIGNLAGIMTRKAILRIENCPEASEKKSCFAWPTKAPFRFIIDRYLPS